MFRRARQLEDESVLSYVTRLRKLVNTCGYGDQEEENIRDQIIDKCSDQRLRKRLLEERELTLERTIQIARAMEDTNYQMNQMKVNTTASDVNTVRTKRQNMQYVQRHDNKPKFSCFRCGKSGHMAKDCFQKDKTCYKCSRVGHIAKVCKTKTQKPTDRRSHQTKHVNCVDRDLDDVDQSNGDVVECIFTVNGHEHMTDEVFINGKPVNAIIDSGAGVNIISNKEFRAHNFGVELKPCCRSIYTYGSKKPMEIHGYFDAQISAKENGKCVDTEMFVVDVDAVTLISRDTAMKLGILKITLQTVQEKVPSLQWDDLKKKYNKVFSGVGKLNDRSVKLHIDDKVKPIAQPVRRVPFHIRQKLDSKLDELLESDIIEPVEGPTPWVSMLVVVLKPSGELRVCVDMRRANEAVVRERHPIPTVEEVLHDMNGAQYFARLDLRMAFHQLELEESSRYITTFVTHKGLFRYKRLMFGITSAPELCQHILQQIVADCEGARNIADDLIVWASTQQELYARVERVLQRLEEKGLTLNEEKCEFGLNELTFMGHLLSRHGIGPTESRVVEIVNQRAPKDRAEVRSFLGMVTFCARYIPDYATVAEPLRELTRQDTKWKWGVKQKKAFDELKERLSNAKTLAYYDVDEHVKTQVTVDASPVGLGAILSQQQADGGYRPVCYASRSLTSVERRYSQTEKEALAVVWGCERFRMYLYGREFELLTDHKPLEMIYSRTSKPSLRIERWALRLLPFTFKVRYIPGSQNIADSLSRLISEPTKQQDVNEDYAMQVAIQAVPQALTGRMVEETSIVYEEIRTVWQAVQTGDFAQVDDVYRHVKNELTTVGRIVMRETRMLIPEKLRTQTLACAHECHQGIVRTKQRLSDTVWWPKIDQEVEKLVSSCHACQVVGKLPPPEPMDISELPDKPWQVLLMDICGPLPTGESVFAIVDYYSRWTNAVIMTKTETKNIINVMSTIFATHGVPEIVVSDNGRNLCSAEMEEYLCEYGIKHRRVTPYWPRANGEVERQNRTLLKAIRTARVEKKDWKKELNKFLLNFRSTPHATTGVSPAELLMGRKLRTKLPQLEVQSERMERQRDSEMRQTDWQRKTRGKEYGDKQRHAIPSDVKEGDEVLLKQARRDKFSTTFEHEPYQVIEKRGHSLILEHADSDEPPIMRNTSACKKYNRAESSSDETVASDHESAVEEQQLRSSSRVKQRPTCLEDYDCNQVI